MMTGVYWYTVTGSVVILTVAVESGQNFGAVVLTATPGTFELHQ